MEISFRGKCALVTGASRGIGRGLVVALAKYGCKVIALGRSKNDLENLKAEIPSIEIIVCDLNDWENTKKSLENIGPIDYLVNNAGEGQIKALVDLEEDDVDR